MGLRHDPETGYSTNRSQNPEDVKIDRSKTCPFLLRMFVRVGDYHEINLFENSNKYPLEDEVQIHTWKDETLKELAELIKKMDDSLMEDHVSFEFSSLKYNKGEMHRTLLGHVTNNGM